MKIETSNTRRLLTACVVGFALLVPVTATAGAQRMQTSSVTTSDIQRLQDDLFQASSDVARSRGTNAMGASLQDELDELREEVIYLKVKLRKEGSVSRNEYVELRNRIQALRSQARGEATGDRRGTWPGGTSGDQVGAYGGGRVSDRTDDRDRGTVPRSQSDRSAIPVGQEIDVRLQTQLSSATAQVEDRFEATTLVDLYRGNDVLIPAGSVLRGVVRTVERATRTDRKGEMTVSFDQITVRGRTYPMRGTVTEAIESEGVKGEAARIGTGAGVGAVIGGILGGVKGALLGVLIGGGGTIAATEGKDVTLEPGTILRVTLDTPPAIR